MRGQKKKKVKTGRKKVKQYGTRSKDVAEKEEMDIEKTKEEDKEKVMIKKKRNRTAKKV